MPVTRSQAAGGDGGARARGSSSTSSSSSSSSSSNGKGQRGQKEGARGSGGGGSGLLGQACTLLVGGLAVLLSGTLQLTRYPPNAFAPVSVRAEFNHEAGGRFVQLSRGRTHYELYEPPAGEVAEGLPPVVLLHGFSMGCRIWKPVAEELVKRGKRRVLAFDLFGRGYSDAAYPCDLSLFTGQLTELLFALQHELGPGPYDIMGTSMGGAIAINFVRLHPQHVRKLVLVAPAGLPVHVPATAKLARLPLIGDIFMPILGPVSLTAHARKGHAFPDDPSLAPIFQEMRRVLMLQKERNPGFFPALLSTLRNFPLSDMEWAYHAVAEKLWANSTLVVWGDLDEVTPFGHSQTVMRIFGEEKARLVVLPQCGHVDALEVPRSIDDMMGPVVAHLS